MELSLGHNANLQYKHVKTEGLHTVQALFAGGVHVDSGHVGLLHAC
mgnify:CR=1 FL=1